jgi:hypothetical protein
MKYLAASAVMLMSLLVAGTETSADAGHTDPVCPTTAHAVQTYADLARSETTRVADVIAAANAASAAFDRCAAKYRAAGDAERAHYAAVGSAQYLFVAGRLLHLDGAIDQARDALTAAIAEVADTIAWGTPQAPSAYQVAAIAVRDAAQDELAKVVALATPAPTASASASATDSPTPEASPSP